MRIIGYHFVRVTPQSCFSFSAKLMYKILHTTDAIFRKIQFYINSGKFNSGNP